ncbi:S8 family serine peptidase [Haloechinothrix aidingensis]|nr:S8 family serine peptidase [Haloechinothrix aidingensis]
MTRHTNARHTGRYLVLLAEGAADAGARVLRDSAGIRTVNSADSGTTGMARLLAETDGLLLNDLELCVVRADPDQARALYDAVGLPGPIASCEPERIVHAIDSPAPVQPVPPTEETLTWGLRAVRAAGSTATGAGVRVAILDTGFDAEHPDYSGRTVERNSFVEEEEDAGDAHGHGTHVIGSACGPREPAEGPGYGVAHESEIYSGKVLDSQGAGTDGAILTGISWAVQHGCAVVSMSLGSPAEPGEPYSRAFEEAAVRAMNQGTLVIAAAGNESRRDSGVVAPVGHPANSPTIMAIGAVDREFAIAGFSSGTVGDVGQVDAVAPGVDIHSSWPMPERVNTISGTSMATPHVAGVAALLAEDTGARDWELWARLSQTARRLPLPSTDVAAGLVQAP